VQGVIPMGGISGGARIIVKPGKKKVFLSNSVKEDMSFVINETADFFRMFFAEAQM